MPVRVILAGLGSLGRKVASAIERDSRLLLVGLVEPRRAGRAAHGLSIMGTLDEAPISSADVLVQTTVSNVEEAAPQIHAALAAGLAVVSSCEELHGATLPPGLGAKEAIDRAARGAGRAVIAAGVNPGFVLDALVLQLARAVRAPRAVRVERIVDLGRRRASLRHKMGVGLPAAAFDERPLGHVGLGLSARIVFAGLFGEPPEVVPVRRVPIVTRGRIVGIRERTVVRKGRSGPAVVAELRMQVGARPERDVIEIRGEPPVRCVFEGGLHGDAATVALLLRAAEDALLTEPGLASLALTAVLRSPPSR